jgi:predicted nuclease of restriction endonuclease-like (RecB) superfamily
MSDSELQQLIELFEATHQRLQLQAARSVDIALVVRNWLFGYYIVEFESGRAERSDLYGKKLIDQLTNSLSELSLRGISPTNLRKYRAFYQAYREIQPPSHAADQTPTSTFQKIQQTMSGESLAGSLDPRSELEVLVRQLVSCFKLSWSHYVALLTINDADARRFYEIEAVANSWNVKELERQMNSALYERLALSRDKEGIRQLAAQGLIVEKAADIIKTPYVLEFLELDQRTRYSESDLESAIIDKLEQFLLELGKGFLFEARQKRFSFDNDHFYVDLVFYNRLLRCYVLLDLKIEKLTHQDLGQMQMYVNYFDRHVKMAGEAPTIGIVLCHSRNEALVELTLPKDSNIYAAEYQLYLPSKEEFQQKLMDWGREMAE